MANDVISRPDWSVAAADTLAGGSHGGGSGFEAPAVSSIPSDLSPRLSAEWGSREGGGVGYRLGVAQHAAGTILGGLIEDSKADLVAAFESLPEGVRTCVVGELAQGVSGHIRGASDAEVNEFAASDIGRDLVRQWGGRAARNVAVYNKRVSRMLDGMTPEGVGWFMAGFITLDAEQMKAVIRELSR